MCRYELKCNNLQCKHLHPKKRQVSPQGTQGTAPVLIAGTQSGSAIVSTVPVIECSTVNTGNTSQTVTTASVNLTTVASVNPTTVASTASDNNQPQGFRAPLMGPDISQILAGIQNAIQALTADVQEIKKDKQLQQQQQQVQQQELQ